MNAVKHILPLFLLFPVLLGAELPYYSQVGQDRLLNELVFKNKKHGVFVDIGAYDGVEGSNSYFFEKKLGWRGICVEPIPELFEKLTRVRNCTLINACVGEKGEKEFLNIIGHDQMLSGLIDKYDPRHMELIQRIAPYAGDKHEIIKVHCIPLMDILKQHNIQHIDYLSVDTEGGELEILKSIDFDQVHIEVIDVENNYNDGRFREFLESKGYTFVTHLVIDDIYVKRR